VKKNKKTKQKQNEENEWALDPDIRLLERDKGKRKTNSFGWVELSYTAHGRHQNKTRENEKKNSLPFPIDLLCIFVWTQTTRAKMIGLGYDATNGMQSSSNFPFGFSRSQQQRSNLSIVFFF
jgi:hypothetical protein